MIGYRSSSRWAAREGRVWVKLLVAVVVLAAVVVGFTQFGDELSLDSLARQEESLRAYQEDHPVLVYGVAFVVYVVVTGLSLPGAAPLTLVYGAFLLSRYLLRDTIQSRFGERAASFNTALEREGAFYLFTLRLIPAVPFFVINVVMGVTKVGTWTYWWVSQLGMFPGTCVFVYAGSAVPNLQELADKGTGGIFTPQILIAFVLLGIFPLVVKKIMGRVRPSSPAAVGESAKESQG
jgi:uncharacterized membrane protein YdjX (TVP38/TMEM64 family)